MGINGRLKEKDVIAALQTGREKGRQLNLLMDSKTGVRWGRGRGDGTRF